MFQLTKVLLIGLFLISFSWISFLCASSFSYPTGLINIPKASFRPSGELEYGSSLGMRSLNKMQFDFKLNYAFTKKLSAGVLLLNYDTVAVNLHGTFFRLNQFLDLSVAGGLSNLTSNPNASTWDDEASNEASNIGHYIVGSMKVKKSHVHLGFGKRLYRKNSPSVVKDFLKNVFFGIERDFFNQNVMMEYDGEYLNLGFRKVFDGKTTLSVAFPELFSLSKSGDDAPRQFIAVSLSMKHNIFQFYKDELSSVKKNIKEFDTMNREFEASKAKMEKNLEEMRAAKKQVIEEIKELKKGQKKSNLNALPTALKKPKYSADFAYEKAEEEIRDKEQEDKKLQAFDFYNKSYQYYSAKKYKQAISSLKRAIELVPNEPSFHIQLGSMYYRFGLQHKAFQSWREAYRIDPLDEDLQKLPKKILAKLKAKAKLKATPVLSSDF